MFQSQTLRLAGNNHRERASICSVQPGLIGRRLLAAMAGVAATAAVAALPRHVAQPSADSAILPQTILLQAETHAILRDRAEALRAEMLAGPGVRAVTIEGLRQQSLSVEYTQHHLAAFGVRPADIEAALPLDSAQSRPGHLTLRTDAPMDIQTAANTPVVAGRHVFRLGDLALVGRAKLDPPVSTLRIGRLPTARLTVVSGR